jgi:HSP20 family molecular chaperone IbpA
MADIKVQTAQRTEDRTLPIFQKVDELLQRIQGRAFELFEGRGFIDGHDIADWVAAEREFCWPATELVEQEKNYALSVALPGFEPAQITVTATPHELIVHASAKTERTQEPAKKHQKVLWSEFRSNDVFRRVELSEPIDLDKVSATLSQGLLKIVAEKAAKKILSAPVSAPA